MERVFGLIQHWDLFPSSWTREQPNLNPCRNKLEMLEKVAWFKKIFYVRLIHWFLFPYLTLMPFFCPQMEWLVLDFFLLREARESELSCLALFLSYNLMPERIKTFGCCGNWIQVSKGQEASQANAFPCPLLHDLVGTFIWGSSSGYCT